MEKKGLTLREILESLQELVAKNPDILNHRLFVDDLSDIRTICHIQMEKEYVSGSDSETIYRDVAGIELVAEEGIIYP